MTTYQTTVKEKSSIRELSMSIGSTWDGSIGSDSTMHGKNTTAETKITPIFFNTVNETMALKFSKNVLRN